MTRSSHPAQHEADRRDKDPRLGAGDGCLEVLGEPATTPEPGESSLDDPSSRQDLETFGRVGALDDFDGPCAEIGQSLRQLFSGIAAVGEQVAQPRVSCRMEVMTPTAPSLCWISAAWTVNPTRGPSMSAMIWRLRPLSFLAAL